MVKPNTYRDRIIDLALKQLGKEYVHGGHGPDYFDCAGLIWYLYNEIYGIDIYQDGYGKSTTTKIMTSSVGKITLYNENSFNKNISLIKPGDILLFHRQSKSESIPTKDNKYPGHCGIYLGDNYFIHATQFKDKNRVIKSKLKKDNTWTKKLVGFKNIFD